MKQQLLKASVQSKAASRPVVHVPSSRKLGWGAAPLIAVGLAVVSAICLPQLDASLTDEQAVAHDSGGGSTTTQKGLTAFSFCPSIFEPHNRVA